MTSFSNLILVYDKEKRRFCWKNILYHYSLHPLEYFTQIFFVPMCTHFMEFDSFYRAGIYRRPCTSDRCEFFGNFMKLAKKYLTDSITKKTAKIKRTESKRFSLKCHIINKGVRVSLKNISLRIIKSELEGITMRLCNYCVIAESDRYRKYWKVSRAYFNFLTFFCRFTFKLVYYLEVIL